MNKIDTNDENINDADADGFYDLLSRCTGQQLDPQKDRILLTKPSEGSRNSKDYLVYCDINNSRRVALKRCADIPGFIRRERITVEAQKALGFPSYNVIEVNGITLRNQTTDRNCKILSGWEDKKFLVIDYGNYNAMKVLRLIIPSEICLLEFFYNYGKFCAFNCLLGVRDRHDKNFVISQINEMLYSVDNEEGPFDLQDNLVDIRLIVTQLKSGIERFFGDDKEPLYKEKLRQGFVDGWRQIAAGLSSLGMLDEKELDLLRGSIVSDPETIFGQLFY